MMDRTEFEKRYLVETPAEPEAEDVSREPSPGEAVGTSVDGSKSQSQGSREKTQESYKSLFGALMIPVLPPALLIFAFMGGGSSSSDAAGRGMEAFAPLMLAGLLAIGVLLYTIGCIIYEIRQSERGIPRPTRYALGFLLVELFYGTAMTMLG